MTDKQLEEYTRLKIKEAIERFEIKEVSEKLSLSKKEERAFFSLKIEHQESIKKESNFETGSLWYRLKCAIKREL